MRGELKTLHQQLGTTALYETHDQMEAMTMADQLVVMRSGSIEQHGSPEAVYSRPESIYTASFLGSPEINLLSAEISADGSCRSWGCDLPLPWRAGDGKAVYGVRPHDITLCAETEPDSVRGRVTLLEPTGSFVIMHVEYGAGGELVVQTQQSPNIKPGSTVDRAINASKAHLFAPTNGLLLSRRED